MSTTAIVSALPGERLIALSPRDDNEAAATWLRRPNLFPGRTLTAATLEDRQLWAAGRLAQRGQAYTAGVVEGLEVGAVWDSTGARPVGLPVVRLQIAAGRGLAVSGEDVVLPRDIDADLFGLPVVAPAGLFDPEAEAEAPGGLRARRIGDPLGRILTDNPGALPMIGVLVLQPVTVDRAGIDPEDPCDRCGCGAAGENVSFEDWRLADAARLLWFAWPDEWRALPADTPRLRNALAYTIFDAEAALPPGETLPWEDYGVPLALVALDGTFQPRFVDAAAVVRQGGRAHVGRLRFAASAAGALSLTPSTRLPMLWQARIMQLAEQIAEAGDPPPAAATLAAAFDRLPPCGLLPTNVYDPVSGVNRFFPAGFELDAAPVPLDQLDLALREAGGLASLDFSRSERVRILVPVSQESWDPRLLLRETLNPEFDATLRRFLSARSRALGMRQALRTIAAYLTQSITGQFSNPPDIDADPGALEPEELEPWGPPPASAGHRSQIRSGLHQHEFESHPAPLLPGAADSLFAWVYLDPDHPPSELMLQWFTGTWEHRAYWGDDLLPFGAPGTAERFFMGPLPHLGEWTRLGIPASNVGLEGQTITGMAFTLYDGRAAFGASGLLGAGNSESRWVDGPLPPEARTGGDEPWEFLAPNQLWTPFEPDFGLVLRGESIEAAGLADLQASPMLAPLSNAERSQLRARGIQGFITYLKARADRADDLIDYGFLKVQTDIYRVRQYMLGTSVANKLIVSPTLASIAQADTAVASQQKLTAFFEDLRDANPNARSRSAIGQDEQLPAAPRAMTTGASAATRAAPFAGRASTESALAIGAIQRFDTPAMTVGTFQKSPLLAEFVSTEIAPLRVPLAPTPRPTDVVNARPVVGQVDIRTTTLAQRLDSLPATEARSYAAATRHDMVLGLIRLADELLAEDAGVMPGLFQDIDLYGLQGDPFLQVDSQSTVRRRPVADLLTAGPDRATRLGLLLNLPPSTNATDESAYFSDSTSLSDATIALLRQVEGRVRLYRDAVAACADTLATIRTHLAAAQSRERQLDEELAEARHDVAVTRALISEEQQRLEAINQRRAAILAQEVRFLAYARLRATDNLSAVPARALDPGLFEATIPVCLNADFDIPDALGGLLRILREAPAGWFVQGAQLVSGLDRVELLAKTLQTAQLRSQVATLRPIENLATMPLGVATTMAQLAAKQSQSVGLARVAAMQIDLARFTSLSWLGAQAEATQVVSLGDLIEGEHGRGDVARAAAEFFDRVSRVSACLFAAFSGVLPSLRLDWAEQLSQFDAAPNLRNLASLPRWQEIEITDRRRMQGYVDWLYGQIDNRATAATSLVNDVVRMALLLASHAPVNRIIAGRLPRPVVARPGLTIPLIALEPARLRIGMQAMVYRANEIVARAIVEDIGGAEASARVLSAAGNSVELDETVRVQFAAAASVSFSATALRLF